MITHDEARVEAVSYNCESIRVILKYITQQEKKDKLFELYKELSNYVDERYLAHESPKITRLKIIIKELENEQR